MKMLNNEIERWCKAPITKFSLIHRKAKFMDEAKNEERNWGCSIQKIKVKGQWTNHLGEHSVKIILDKIFTEVKSQPKIKLRDGKIFIPDFQAGDFFFEVKTRNWTTEGTIGEKIIGSGYKYLPLVEETRKKILIVGVAYAEWEMCNKLNLCGNGMSNGQKKVLNFFEQEGVYFLPRSNLEEFLINRKN